MFSIRTWASCLFRRRFGVLAMLVLATVGDGADLTGVYADTGTSVASARGQSLKEPSLHALLRLEFDPQLAARRADQADHVRVKHDGKLLEIEAYNLDGEVSWRGSWREGEGYARQEDRVLLHFSAKGAGSKEIVFTLESVTEHGLLQVTAQRLTPTLLGPVAEIVGVFLFHRVP